MTTSPTLYITCSPSKGQEITDFGVKSPKGRFEKISLLFWKPEHQRTFSAYLPGSLIFIFFAISEDFRVDDHEIAGPVCTEV